MEIEAGHIDRAVNMDNSSKRWICTTSLHNIKQMYLNGEPNPNKSDYIKALQTYQAYLGEIKSQQRDEAAAAHEKYRYYSIV